MIDEKNKNVLLKIAGLAFSVFLLTFAGMYIFGTTNTDLTLPTIIKGIDVTNVAHKGVPIEIDGTDLKDILPDISKYPPQVEKSTTSYIEIFSSPEKAGSGTDGWLTEVARDFNRAEMIIEGKQVSVRLRGIASGQGADYITSQKHLPDAYTVIDKSYYNHFRSG